jgi:hypothetical protein
MSTTEASGFVDRRGKQPVTPAEWVERRQFGENRDHLNPEVREIAEAIDSYKLNHRRRFVTLEEVVEVMKGLGYRKGQGPSPTR